MREQRRIYLLRQPVSATRSPTRSGGDAPPGALKLPEVNPFVGAAKHSGSDPLRRLDAAPALLHVAADEADVVDLQTRETRRLEDK